MLVQVFWWLFLLFCWYCSVFGKNVFVVMPITACKFLVWCTAERINRKCVCVCIYIYIYIYIYMCICIYIYIYFFFALPNLSSSCSFSFPLSVFAPLLLICCLPCFPSGEVCSSIKHIQGSLTFNFLFVLLFYPLPVCHTRPPPSLSISVSFSLLFFTFVISLLSAHNPWFYLKLLPSEHWSFCWEMSSFLALHLQTLKCEVNIQY